MPERVYNAASSMAKTDLPEIVSKGYSVDDTGVLYRNGRVLVAEMKNGYWAFRAQVSRGCRVFVGLHQLVAYQSYGERYLKPGIVARHLNGISGDNRRENIAIGTESENRFDIPSSDRTRSAVNAAKHLQKYSEADVQQWTDDHRKGLGFRKLEKKYLVPRSTLSYYLSHKAKRHHSGMTFKEPSLPVSTTLPH